jgi:nicotinamide mononucleotide adenylyltransferase
MENYLVKSENKTKTPNKYALFIGRWQPLHDGHKWLFNQKLELGESVCIAIRDMPQDDKNWWSAEEIKQNIENEYAEYISSGRVKVIVIPDIDSINFGRGVGYDIVEHIPPQDINDISATKIRESLLEKKDIKNRLYGR